MSSCGNNCDEHEDVSQTFTLYYKLFLSEFWPCSTGLLEESCCGGLLIVCYTGTPKTIIKLLSSPEVGLDPTKYLSHKLLNFRI
jgi:hypothetical protein